MKKIESPVLEAGQMFASRTYGGKVGVVVKARCGDGLGRAPSYDIAWADENGEGLRMVSERLLISPLWERVPGRMQGRLLEDLHFSFLKNELQKRSRQAQERSGSAPAQEDFQGYGAYYRPSQILRHQAHEAAGGGASAHLGASIKKALQEAYDGVKFSVRMRGASAIVSWEDGPISVDRDLQPFISRKDGWSETQPLEHATQKREISDILILAAAEYACCVVPGVRQALRGFDNEGMTVDLYRTGAISSIYPGEASPYSGISVGSLMRALLMRWDDYELGFGPLGKTYGMVLENQALFGERTQDQCNATMRQARELALDRMNPFSAPVQWPAPRPA